MNPELPEWLQVSDLYAIRDYYYVLRKKIPKGYGLAALLYSSFFFGVGVVCLTPWYRALYCLFIGFVCAVVGVIDWILVTRKIEWLSTEINKTGINLRI